MQTDFAFMTNYWRDLKPPPVHDASAQPRDPARKASGAKEEDGDEDETKAGEEFGWIVTRMTEAYDRPNWRCAAHVQRMLHACP